jgi:hypothetical protein
VTGDICLKEAPASGLRPGVANLSKISTWHANDPRGRADLSRPLQPLCYAHRAMVKVLGRYICSEIAFLQLLDRQPSQVEIALAKPSDAPDQ